MTGLPAQLAGRNRLAGAERLDPGPRALSGAAQGKQRTGHEVILLDSVLVAVTGGAQVTHQRVAVDERCPTGSHRSSSMSRAQIRTHVSQRVARQLMSAGAPATPASASRIGRPMARVTSTKPPIMGINLRSQAPRGQIPMSGCEPRPVGTQPPGPARAGVGLRDQGARLCLGAGVAQHGKYGCLHPAVRRSDVRQPSPPARLRMSGDDFGDPPPRAAVRRARRINGLVAGSHIAWLRHHGDRRPAQLRALRGRPRGRR